MTSVSQALANLRATGMTLANAGRSMESVASQPGWKDLLDTLYDELVTSLRADPSAHRAMKWINERRSRDAMTPAVGLGLQRLEALWLITDPGRYDIENTSAPVPLHEVAGLAGRILSAVPYLWSREILQLAWSLPLPKHIVTTEMMPHEQMVWTPQRPWHVSEEGGAGLGSVYHWLLERHPTGISIIAIGEKDGTHQGWLHLSEIKDGMRYPDDFPGMMHNILSMMSFLNSPFVSSKFERPPKGSKAARRKQPQIGDVGIRVVRLRQEATRRIEETERHAASGFSHRWIVRGHHRAQWYPSLSAHKVIWIAPYIKGPQDRPIESPVYVVAR